jgi:hypothetical protein
VLRELLLFHPGTPRLHAYGYGKKTFGANGSTACNNQEEYHHHCFSLVALGMSQYKLVHNLFIIMVATRIFDCRFDLVTCYLAMVSARACPLVHIPQQRGFIIDTLSLRVRHYLRLLSVDLIHTRHPRIQHCYCSTFTPYEIEQIFIWENIVST